MDVAIEENVPQCEDSFDSKLSSHSKLVDEKEVLLPEPPSDHHLQAKSSEKEIEERLLKLKIFNRVWFGEESSFEGPVKPAPSDDDKPDDP